MKQRILVSSLALLISLTLVPQGMSDSANGLPRPSPQANAAADRAWSGFFAALRTAVQKRDRAALREMMTREFRFDCCDNMDENGNGETRDEAFRWWDKSPNQGWGALNRLLAQGVVPASAGWTSSNGRSKPNLIAPPRANSRKYGGPIADFEWRNGRWWFMSFQYPEND